MAQLAHPNVVPVFDVGTHGDQLFVAMELVRGVTLRAWLAARRRPWREVLDVAVQAGRGLAAAHAAGLVHRDFKPENVLVGADGRARVVDFGLARAVLGVEADVVLTPADAGLTGAGAVLGTLAYMAPEQKQGGAADARSDQYSFCLTVHEALHGERPEAGVATGAGNPAWLDALLDRGRRVDPTERFTSMDELLDAIAAGPRRRWGAGRLALISLGLLAAAGAVVAWHARARRWAPVASAVVSAGGCGRSGPVVVETYHDRAAFEAALGAHRVVDFDDVDASAGIVSIAPDRYAASLGVVIRGTEGQYVDRDFGFPHDFSPSSPPNLYAPGPRAPVDSPVAAGGHDTDVTFLDRGRPACVAGVGAIFIDHDYIYAGEPTGLTVLAAGTALGRALSDPAGGNNSKQFRGIVTRDEGGDPVPAIDQAHIDNGNTWIQVAAGEGVGLDDLVFGIPSAP
jgi:hypothetical protein